MPFTVQRLSPAIIVNDQNSNVYPGETVTVLANGNYVVTWSTYAVDEYDENGWHRYQDVIQRVFDQNGNPIGTEVLINEPKDGINREPIVTALPDGRYVVTWSSSTFGSEQYLYQRIFDATGNALGPRIQVSDKNFLGSHTVELAPDGGYRVLWMSETNNNSDIFQRHFDANGNPIDAERLIHAVNSVKDFGVDVVNLPNGSYIAVWTSDFDIHQQLFDAADNPIGSITSVSNIDLFSFDSRITPLPNGGYVVTWRTFKFDNVPGYIAHRAYDSSGNPLGPENLLPTHTFNWTATALTNGRYVITWDNFQRLYDANGNPLGDIKPIGEGQFAFAESVNALPDGGYAITLSDDGIYQRTFDSNGDPTSPPILIGSGFDVRSVQQEDGSYLIIWQARDEVTGQPRIYQRLVKAASLGSLSPDIERAIGSSDDDMLSITPQVLTVGDAVDAGQGYDILQLEIAGRYDFTIPDYLSGFELLQGSAGDDVVATNISRIESFLCVDLGSGFDVVQLIVNGHTDLRALPQLNGIEKIQVEGSDADDTVIADSRFGPLLAIDLGFGDDLITLGVAGTYNLQGAKNVEEIKGTIRDDVLIVDWTVLSSGTAIDLDRGSDILELAGGGTFRLFHSLLAGIEKFVVSDGSTTKVIGTKLQDVVVGGTGQDHIVGGAGKDQLSGGSGSDRIEGGSDGDRLTGGEGKDAFIFTSRPGLSNVDTITDFSVKDDAIWLDNAVFRKVGKGTLTKPVKLKSDAFTIGKEAKDAEDRVIYDKGTGRLSYDPDGTGSASAVKFAQVKKGLALKSTDFFVI